MIAEKKIVNISSAMSNPESRCRNAALKEFIQNQHGRVYGIKKAASNFNATGNHGKIGEHILEIVRDIISSIGS